jgi:hypothetical protein
MEKGLTTHEQKRKIVAALLGHRSLCRATSRRCPGRIAAIQLVTPRFAKQMVVITGPARWTGGLSHDERGDDFVAPHSDFEVHRTD